MSGMGVYGGLGAIGGAIAGWCMGGLPGAAALGHFGAAPFLGNCHPSKFGLPLVIGAF